MSGFFPPRRRPLPGSTSPTPPPRSACLPSSTSSASDGLPPPSTSSRTSSWRSCPPSSRPSDHLLHKLMLRQSFGEVRCRRFPTRTTRAPLTKLFTRLPARLAFCLKDAVPMSAIEAGHIFLGFSKCGQFLLSYTQTAADFDMLGECVNYHYRLHWWLFVPYRRSKKVAEILLFSNDGVAGGNLRMTFCQWPNDDTKIVIYGSAVGECGGGADVPAFSPPSSSSMDEGTPSPISCYLTVTAVPSLNGCKDCVRVAASYCEEDVAEAWNSCVRLSCLEHGVTVHTAFDLVTPYPKFDPRVSLKRNGTVVVNTGNLLHSFHVQLETLGAGKGAASDLLEQTYHQSNEEQPLNPMMLSILSSPPRQQSNRLWSELNVATGSEFTLSGGEVFSPLPPALCSPAGSSAFNANQYYSDSETTDCESDCGNHNRYKEKKTYYVKNQERLEKVSEFVEQLQSPPTKRILLSSASSSSAAAGRQFHDLDQPHPGGGSKSKRIAAEKAYELTDDDLHDDGAVVREKLSTFRRKRLAERTFEFKDEEDAENITPLSRLRQQRYAQEEEEPESTTQSASSTAKSPLRSTSECEVNILKPISNNQNSSSSQSAEIDEDVSGLVVDTMPELLSPGGMVKKDASSCSPRPSTSSAASQPAPPPQQELPPPPPRFHAKFTRRFIEIDDEMISVVTECEDEDQNSHAVMATTSFHTVLPLSVHGSGYQPLAMISNAKAGKLSNSGCAGRRCVKVQQRSVDLELLCHYMAQRLCAAAGKKYWFCNDYDVEIVDFDPESGDIVCVAVVLVKATVVTKRVSQHQKYSISSLHRRQYQASFRFSWNVDTAQCSVIDSEPLSELSQGHLQHGAAAAGGGGIWHPARNVSLALQKAWGPSISTLNGIKFFSNEAVIRGASLKSIIDSEHLVAIIQDNLE